MDEAVDPIALEDFDSGFGPSEDGFGEDDYQTMTTYEELCRQHIDKYLSRAQEEFHNDTELTKRVTQWRDRVAPMLSEQESRPEFDLFKSKDVILGSLRKYVKKNKENRKGVLPPTVAIGGEEKWQVARNFAAMLQLVNNGQIELLPDQASHQSFNLRLLSAS